MRFLKAAACLAGSVCAFTVPFFDRIPVKYAESFKNAGPFVVQMLLGWALFFAALYHLVCGVRETIAKAKGRG